MVEGPGCKLKGIKIKGKLKGQTVKHVRGNAVDKFTKKDSNRSSPFHQLIGRTLDSVETLGKELFMYFGDLCLRVHFLMAGQSFINNQSVDKDSGGKAETAILELQMTADLLTFRNSSADIRQAAVCHQKYLDLNDVDICSPVFNFRRAVSMVMEQQDRLICDVLLDQSILPGVGNIIKNEALFDSGIRPNSKVKELKEDHIKHLIKMTRDFTDIFYICRRDGKALYPYYKIYSKRRCKQCEGKVTICRLGEDSDRVTYFCEACQTNDLKNKQRNLPVKNSLLGWVTKETTEETTPEWACPVCTLINVANQSNCSACLNMKPSKQEMRHQESTLVQESKPGHAHLNQLAQNSSQGSRSVNTLNSRTCPVMANTKKRSSATEYKDQSAKVMKLQSNVTSRSTETDDSISSHGQNQSKQPLQTQPTNQSQESSHRIPPCPTHKKQCNLKEVHKKGDNHGRWFFTCHQRSCNFFEWADVKFPICAGHGKPCTLRTVMKIGPNNGRKFFACKLPKNKQCKFFEWAIGFG